MIPHGAASPEVVQFSCHIVKFCSNNMLLTPRQPRGSGGVNNADKFAPSLGGGERPAAAPSTGRITRRSVRVPRDARPPVSIRLRLAQDAFGQLPRHQFTADRRRSADADRLRGDQHTLRYQGMREGAGALALLPDAVLDGDDHVLEEHHVRTTDRRPPDAMTAVSDPRDQTEARDRRAHIAPRPASATPSSAREAGSGASLTVLEVRDCDSANGVPTVDVDAI